MKKLATTSAVIVALFGVVATATPQSVSSLGISHSRLAASSTQNSPEPTAAGALVAGAAAFRHRSQRRK